MDCPKCYGRGRIVFEAHVGLGGVVIPDITHIEPCDMCQCTGKLYCCEGERGDVLLAVGEMKDGTTVVMEAMEVNPNEAG